MPVGTTNESLSVVMNLEEYESIRLSDFDLHGQMKAAELMQVSRPTFARIYESARRKVALAFMEGRPIVFEGGKVYFNSEWHSCNSCGCWFNHPEKEKELKNCPLCGSSEIEQIKEDALPEKETVCVCPDCGKKKKYIPGKTCKNDRCPDCQTPMTRKGIPCSK